MPLDWVNGLRAVHFEPSVRVLTRLRGPLDFRVFVRDILTLASDGDASHQDHEPAA
jgi:hypothetical protein